MNDLNDREQLLRFFRGDEAAVELAFMLARISHIWDDLIDKDKPVSDHQVNAAFWLALVGVPANPFYQQHSEDLRPVMASGILNYAAANALERRGDLHSLEIAHVIRYSIADTVLLMATLAGGYAWGMEVASDLRLLCQKDTFWNYLTEKRNEPTRT
ncbi:MAG: hypothetical protein HY661_19310 [Betaproteobacteria bacterium]|nr:hypothetical protein [Betaproteobacteria bacterium]